LKKDIERNRYWIRNF